MSRATTSWIIIYTIFAGIINFKSAYEASNYLGMAFALGSILVVVSVLKHYRDDLGGAARR
jgi:hypothetical protein